MKRLLIFCLLSAAIILALFAWYAFLVWGDEFNSVAFQENIGFILHGEAIYVVAIIRAEFLETDVVWFRSRVGMPPEDILRRGPNDSEVSAAIGRTCKAIKEAIRKDFPGVSVEILNPKDGSWISLGVVGRLVSYPRNSKNSSIFR